VVLAKHQEKDMNELALTDYDRVFLAQLSIAIPEDAIWDLGDLDDTPITDAIRDADKAIRGALE